MGGCFGKCFGKGEVKARWLWSVNCGATADCWCYSVSTRALLPLLSVSVMSCCAALDGATLTWWQRMTDRKTFRRGTDYESQTAILEQTWMSPTQQLSGSKRWQVSNHIAIRLSRYYLLVQFLKCSVVRNESNLIYEMSSCNELIKTRSLMR